MAIISSPMAVISPRRERSRSPAAQPRQTMPSSEKVSLVRVARAGRFRVLMRAGEDAENTPAKKVMEEKPLKVIEKQPPRKGRIGIIGGSGPEAGLDLFSKVLVANRKHHGEGYRGDCDGPNVVVSSDSSMAGPHGTFDMVPCLDRQGPLWPALEAVVTALAPQVDYFCICCNTLHFVAPPMLAMMKERGIKARFVSIVDAVGVYCRKHGIASVRVLGSLVSTDCGPTGMSPYKSLEDQGIALGVHEPEQQELQQQTINMIKRCGPENKEAHKMMQSIVDVAGTTPVQSSEQETCYPQGLLLACTEMPLVRHVLEAPPGVQLLDPTLILAEYLVSLSFNEETLGM
jgi:aspartate racemase